MPRARENLGGVGAFVGGLVGGRARAGLEVAAVPVDVEAAAGVHLYKGEPRVGVGGEVGKRGGKPRRVIGRAGDVGVEGRPLEVPGRVVEEVGELLHGEELRFGVLVEVSRRGGLGAHEHDERGTDDGEQHKDAQHEDER